MQINFDTDNTSNNEAAGLVMLLITLYPGLNKQLAAETVTTTLAEVRSAPLKQGETVHSREGTAVHAAVASAAHVHIGATVAPDDNPAAGAATAAEVFGGPIMTAVAGGISYADHIAQGWTDAQLIEHGRMVANAAAAIFGAPSAPLAQANGAPPAPNSAAGTASPPPSDAATVFGATSGTPAPPPPGASGGADSTPLVLKGIIDSDGLPWEGRIHAATRTQTAKGAWKKKKGVDDATIAAVTAELRAVQAANKAAEHTPLNAAPPPPPAAGNAAPPPPPASTGPVTFVNVAQYVGERKFTAEQILTVCKAHGLPGLALLTGAPALCAPVMAAFQAL